MNIETLQSKLAKYVLASPGNAIQADWALREEIVGTPMFDAPIVGCASADDPLFARIKAEDKILGETFRLPNDWLPSAKSIISIFYPFSEQMRKSNWDNLGVPSDEWLHGRIEGHEFIHATDRLVESWLRDEGFETCIPALEPSLIIHKREPEEAVGRPMFVSPVCASDYARRQGRTIRQHHHKRTARTHATPLRRRPLRLLHPLRSLHEALPSGRAVARTRQGFPNVLGLHGGDEDSLQAAIWLR